ncbi:hypothetical protein IQ231_20675 [Cuspidothrix issatschenkoi LEGE 03284]|uniref:hypothetical protein n=1 Tax=Cuspidothrix issatschenkoi TaxID=230752 RepID=UPI00187FFEB1|nr:hypothetical protein [Cuspidothrix issatschenkoi]MBE9234012.1 hypothetical protein [Cuspidothrix issatschenkoi LEGE 03284]
MISSFTDTTVKAAISAINSESATTEEKIQMLIELANGLQKKPKTAADLRSAVQLYEQAEEICSQDYLLLKARAKVGKATALRSIPDDSSEFLVKAKIAYEEALPTLQELGSSVEVAELQMNFGLVLQSLVHFNLAKIGDCIQLYNQALQVFTCGKYPQEYAILYNNIAIAYLSITGSKEKKAFSEGLAVQTFETALKQINLIEHPREYAMLQNNLGNALQYLQSTHPVENNLRAVTAYNEALKVRNPQDTPLEYANTIANKANALINLPDDLENPDLGNYKNLLQAKNYYQQAWVIFQENQQIEQAQMVGQALQEITAEILAISTLSGDENYE